MLRHMWALVLIVLASVAFPSGSSSTGASLPSTSGPLPYPTTHVVPINLVFVGFNNFTVKPFDLIQDLPSTINPYVQEPQENLGVNLSMNYTTSYYYNETADRSMREFIQSAMTVKSPPLYLQQFFSGTDPAQYGVIQTKALENWLTSNQNEFGISSSRYALIIANLTGVSTYDHYYEATFDSRDVNFQGSRYANSGYFFPAVNWLISWGGAERFYFIDLSAGSRNPRYDYSLSNPPHVPIQYFFPKFRAATNESITQYVADYASQAIRHLIIQDYSRFPSLSPNRTIRIFLIDDTERMYDSNYQNFVNVSLIEQTLQSLDPNANLSVGIQFMQLQTDRQLLHVVRHSIISETKEVGFGQTGLIVDHYDAGQIYAYLKSQLGTFTGYPENQTIPIFLLALKSAGRLVEVSRESEVQTGPVDPDGLPRDASVFVYPELALISLNERQLFDWGVGFSRSTTQAAGNMLGLQEGAGLSFAGATPSVMSSFTFAFGFTTFEKDAINRAYADYFLSFDRLQLDTISTTNALSVQNFQDLASQKILANASALVASGEQSYGSLDFPVALQDFEQGYFLIEHAFYSHVQWLNQSIDAMNPVLNFAGANLIMQARGELGNALTARGNGELAESFQHLAQATFDVALAMNAEQSYGSTLGTDIALFLVAFVLGWIVCAVVRSLRRSGDIGRRHGDPALER